MSQAFTVEASSAVDNSAERVQNCERHEPQRSVPPPTRRPPHRHHRRALLEHPGHSVLWLNGDAALPGSRCHVAGEGSARRRYANGSARCSHAFWSRLWMVRRVSVSRRAFFLDPRSPCFPIWRGEGRGALRTLHLDGDVAGCHSPTRPSAGGDQHSLVDPTDRTHSIRRITNRRIDLERLPRAEGIGQKAVEATARRNWLPYSVAC